MKTYLGIDIGSISTNLVLIDEKNQVLDHLYLRTDGNPIKAVQNGLKKLKLRAGGFDFCTEVLVKAHNAGLRFAEVPAIERKRLIGRSKVNALLDGLTILKMILKKYD